MEGASHAGRGRRWSVWLAAGLVLVALVAAAYLWAVVLRASAPAPVAEDQARELRRDLLRAELDATIAVLEAEVQLGSTDVGALLQQLRSDLAALGRIPGAESAMSEGEIGEFVRRFRIALDSAPGDALDMLRSLRSRLDLPAPGARFGGSRAA